MESGKCGAYTALPLPCEGWEIVSDRAIIKQIQ